MPQPPTDLAAEIDRFIAEYRACLHRALWIQGTAIVVATVALIKLLP